MAFFEHVLSGLNRSLPAARRPGGPAARRPGGPAARRPGGPAAGGRRPAAGGWRPAAGGLSTSFSIFQKTMV